MGGSGWTVPSRVLIEQFAQTENPPFVVDMGGVLEVMPWIVSASVAGQVAAFRYEEDALAFAEASNEAASRKADSQSVEENGREEGGGS